jgi:uncharacterized protein (TIGR01777 family)
MSYSGQITAKRYAKKAKKKANSRNNDLRLQNFAVHSFVQTPMKAVITGGTGLVGKKLINALHKEGYDVTVFSRSAKPMHGVTVQPWPLNPDGRKALTEAHVVFNLAGAPVAQRWSEHAKREILESRTDTTDAVVNALSNRETVLVSASAIGLYAEGDQEWSEAAKPASGFLADVVKAWETSAMRATENGHRVVCLRIGLVLSPDGGALGKLLPLFKLGLGSAVGDGSHWQSWIHIDDLVAMMLFAAKNGTMNGAYNAVAPHPVSNKTLSKALAKALKKPFFLPPVPAFVLKMFFGRMSSIVLASQRVSSQRIRTAGFTFAHPTVDEAMSNLFK